jgi:hypothetical protein
MINFKKITDTLGEDVVADFTAAKPDELKATVVHATQAINKAKEELEANPKYQQLKESLKDISAAFKDCKKYQTAKITLALHLLKDLNDE